MDNDGLATISHGALAAGINPRGAELSRLTWNGQCELLWPGDANIWSGHAPILFPIVGMLADGQYRYEGQTYRLPKHGFARTSVFDIVALNPNEVRLRLEADAATRTVYPFEFRLDLIFTAAGNALSMRALVSNHGTGPMPMSFGFHPAFRRPLPFGGARADHAIVFDQAEPAPVRRINGAGLLLPEGEPTPVVGDKLLLRDSLFEDDALIFDALRSRRLRYGAGGTHSLEIAFDLPYLGIWSKPGADFVAIEPWQGYNDPVGFAGDIRDKPGIVQVDPGDTRAFAMSITVKDRSIA